MLKKKRYGIAMALYTDDKNSVYGALRNIQLSILFLPSWQVYIFIPIVDNHTQVLINDNLKQKMITLGASILYIDIKTVNIPLSAINTLIADDNGVTHFLIRDVRHRLSGCDAEIAQDFITSDKDIHFFKNKGGKHKDSQILPGIWEGNRKKIAQKLEGKTMLQFIRLL